MKISTSFNTRFRDNCLYSRDIKNTMLIKCIEKYVFSYLEEHEVIIPTKTNKRALKLYVIVTGIRW